MKYLIFDTETTGLPKRKSYEDYYDFTDFDKYKSARIVSIAWSFWNDTNQLGSGYFIVKPSGFKIDNTCISTKIHGITQEIADKEGKDLQWVLNKFMCAVKEVDTIVGHNLAFDKNIVLAELSNLGELESVRTLLSKTEFCTMKKSKSVVKAKNKYNKIKYPKLSELYAFYFNTNFDNAHNAQADVNATVKCYQKLVGLN
jgi:DNA polymerase III epsilon subunit-like protein